MNEFPPGRQPGLTVLTLLLGVCLAWVLMAGWLVSRSSGVLSVVYVALAVLAFLPMPWLGYLLYALQHATYLLDRDTLTLQWGFRLEQIPLADIEWARPAALLKQVSLPALRLPGALLGRGKDPQLGSIEFLASNRQRLLFIGTARGVYAISPSEVEEFLSALRRVLEMGSLSPGSAQSVYPSFVILQAWSIPLARFCWTAAVVLYLGAWLWAIWLIPSLPSISLGFLANGAPAPVVPGIYLLLLPSVGLMLALLAWVLGLLLYRDEERRPWAYVLWAGNLLSGLAFLLAMFFVLTASV